MKTTEMNIIAKTQNAEKIAAEKAAHEAEVQAIIDGVQECDILIMLAEVKEKKLTAITDSCDHIVGINRAREISGLKCAKLINNNLIVGNDEKELEQDRINYLRFMKQYSKIAGGPQKAFEICLMLNAADMFPDAAEYISSTYYFFLLKDKKVINDKGATIVDLSADIPGAISNELLLSILKDKLTIALR